MFYKPLFLCLASLFFILPVLNKISYFESKVFDDINGVALN